MNQSTPKISYEADSGKTVADGPIGLNRDYAAIQRALIITFLFNLVATGAKLSAGLSTGALSLVADGLDTLFDGLSNVIGVIAVRMGSRPPDADHPYGHRKFETLAALIIGSLLFVTVWELTKGAIERLLAPTTPQVTGWSVVVLLFAAAVQAGTGWWELRRGRRLGSEVLVADARHTLASIYVSGAVLIGLGLVTLGYTWADPAVALFVSGVIAKIGVDTMRENIPAPVDKAPMDIGVIERVVSDVLGVQSFHRIRSRGTADNVAVDLHVRVLPHLGMQEGNAIGDEVRRRLLGLAGVEDVTVHIEAERGAESAADLYSAVKLAADELAITLHEFWVQEVDGELYLHLHVGVDPNLTLAAAHDQVDSLEQTIRERCGPVRSVYSHIELATADILPSARVSGGLLGRISHIVNEAVNDIPELSHPHNIQVHQVEGKLFIAVEAYVAGDLSITVAHDLSNQLQQNVRTSLPTIGEVLVHLEPIPESDGQAAAAA